MSTVLISGRRQIIWNGVGKEHPWTWIDTSGSSKQWDGGGCLSSTNFCFCMCILMPKVLRSDPLTTLSCVILWCEVDLCIFGSCTWNWSYCLVWFSFWGTASACNATLLTVNVSTRSAEWIPEFSKCIVDKTFLGCWTFDDVGVVILLCGVVCGGQTRHGCTPPASWVEQSAGD